MNQFLRKSKISTGRLLSPLVNMNYVITFYKHNLILQNNEIQAVYSIFVSRRLSYYLQEMEINKWNYAR